MSDDFRCPVRIRLWPKSDGLFQCAKLILHDGEHAAEGLYPDQTISWFDGDRRSFTGEFVPCDQSDCILPSGHHGNHAS